MQQRRDTQADQIAEWMAGHDRFARLLGIELESAQPGLCQASLQVTEQMLNAVGMTHGGVTFGLADFTFAVASNTHGRVAVALNAQISYPAASRLGDRLRARAHEESRTGRTALYSVEVKNQDDELVALFTGTAYRRRETVSDQMSQTEPTEGDARE